MAAILPRGRSTLHIATRADPHPPSSPAPHRPPEV